jgi:hypothetical protein
MDDLRYASNRCAARVSIACRSSVDPLSHPCRRPVCHTPLIPPWVRHRGLAPVGAHTCVSTFRGNSALIFPKVLEPFRRQHGVADDVLDVFVPQIMLERPRVLTVIGQLEPAVWRKASSRPPIPHDRAHQKLIAMLDGRSSPALYRGNRAGLRGDHAGHHGGASTRSYPDWGSKSNTVNPIESTAEASTRAAVYSSIAAEPLSPSIASRVPQRRAWRGSPRGVPSTMYW